jgi:cell division septal protein FtsQ
MKNKRSRIPDRTDRNTLERQERARAHLHRVRRGRPRNASRPRAWALAVAAVALAGGAILGQDLAATLTGMTRRPVDRIAVRGAGHLEPSAVAAAASIAPGTSIGDLDPDALKQTLEQHDWIASAEALRLPGGTLVLGVVEREPSATVAIGDAIYAVDAEGSPFAQLDAAPEPALPRIVSQGEVKAREPSPQLAEAVRLARRLPQLGLAAPAEVQVSREDDPEGYTLRLATPDAHVVLGREQLDARLEDLARLLAARPDELAEATRIDLRFADQVVLRSTPAGEGSANTAAGRGGGGPRNGRPAG